jgi:large subunit ribosomal protein L18
MVTDKKALRRKQRQQRIRKRIKGTDECPRICVFRSSRHIYAQAISDESGRTLASASSLSAVVGSSARGVEAAKVVGRNLAEVCKEKGIAKVVFDRNGFLYHGRVKALADAAREAGLTF